MTLAVLGGGLFGWGLFSSLSGAVIATGQVEVETRDQVVEHLDGGTVAAILVRDGDRVEAGEVVIRLGSAKLRSEVALLEAEHAELVARRNRLEAEFQNANAVTWGRSAGCARRDRSRGSPRRSKARHDCSLPVTNSGAGQVAQLRERIGQTLRQIAGLKAQADAIARQSSFVGRELDAQRELFEKGLTELSRLLALEREAAAPRRAGRRHRGPDRRCTGPNRGNRNPDPADRGDTHREGREHGARGPGPGEPSR